MLHVIEIVKPKIDPMNIQRKNVFEILTVRDIE